MTKKTIDAINVRQGDTVTAMTIVYTSPFLKRKRVVDQEIRQTNGQWPTVAKASFLEPGERCPQAEAQELIAALDAQADNERPIGA